MFFVKFYHPLVTNAEGECRSSLRMQVLNNDIINAVLESSYNFHSVSFLVTTG